MKILIYLSIITLTFNLSNCMQKSEQDILHDKLCAFASMNADKIKEILESRETFDINHKCSNNDTPLHIAVKTGQVKIIDLILNYNIKSWYSLFGLGLYYPANINAQNNQGNTPLHEAAKATTIKFITSAQHLLDNLHHDIDVNIKNNEERTALHILLSFFFKGKKFQELVDQKLLLIGKLIKKGAQIDLKDKAGNTALHLAAFTCKQDMDSQFSLRILKALIEKSIYINLNIQNNKDDTPLHMVARYCKVNAKDIVNLLLKYGADVNIYNIFSLRPIDVAILKNNKEVVEALLHNQGQVSNLNINEQIGENITLEKKYKHIFSGGETALHLAAYIGNQHIINLLLNAGIDRTIRNNECLTAEDITKKKHSYLIHSLQSLSATLSALSRK